MGYEAAVEGPYYCLHNVVYRDPAWCSIVCSKCNHEEVRFVIVSKTVLVATPLLVWALLLLFIIRENLGKYDRHPLL